MADVRTHYDNLKVARDAPEEVIRAAYRSLTQKYHPDRNPGDERAARIMSLLNQSYAVLSDQERRREHDAWIDSQKLDHQQPPRGRHSAPRPPADERGVILPTKGSALFVDLPAATQAALKERQGRLHSDRAQVLLAGVGWGYGGLAVAGAWATFLFNQASHSRWQPDAQAWFLGLTLIAAVIFWFSARKVLRWYFCPLKPALLATPLYVVRTDHERVWFWPIHEAGSFQATHHFRNGSYNYTAVSAVFSGEKQHFTFSAQAAYEYFAGALGTYLSTLNTAARESNQSYVDSHDLFKLARISSPEAGWQLWSKRMPIWAYAGLSGLVVAWLSIAINSQTAGQSYPPESSSYAAVPAAVPTPGVPPPSEPAIVPMRSELLPAETPAPSQDYNLDPNSSPVQVGVTRDHIKERLGREPPPDASYVPGEPIASLDGHSTVMVDNSRNTSDVLVKLFLLSGPGPAVAVRTFFIPEGGTFMARDIPPGRYDVRYLDRRDGSISKSEEFDLQETQSPEGIEYSALSLTLYKVANGNMRTVGISPEEFQ